GYAMRGGEIYIRGNTGYRAGIHMKAYERHQPAVVVGGKAGSFLGEYQAGGKIIVLNLNPGEDGRPITGEFLGTGMHGGAMYLRMDEAPDVPKQISVSMARGTELPEIKPYISTFCEHFKEFDKEAILSSMFAVLKPNSANPYHQLYTAN
ncbi:MAG: glutamate synthase, partial [Treponemataceae bacterium]|nr:glutamate synthase [Treponemataceae bacterium]